MAMKIAKEDERTEDWGRRRGSQSAKAVFMRDDHIAKQAEERGKATLTVVNHDRDRGSLCNVHKVLEQCLPVEGTSVVSRGNDDCEIGTGFSSVFAERDGVPS